MNEQIVSAMIGLLSGLIIGFFAERWSHNLELKRVYLAPFKKWCAEFYDELHEFKERYLNSGTQRDISDLQVIDDWRSLHDVSAYASGWLAKVRLEDEALARTLEDLLCTIDESWHKLEDCYQFVLKDRADIINLCVSKQKKVASTLRHNVCLLNKDDVCTVLRYLITKVPTEGIFLKKSTRFMIRLWQGSW